MTRIALAAAMLATTVAAASAAEELDGYAEWRQGDHLIVDGQRLRLAADGRFDGDEDATRFGAVPLGYEVKAEGERASDGSVVGRRVRVKANGVAMYEKQVRQVTDQAEAGYRRAGSFYQTAGNRRQVVGRLRERGPEVDRVRGIMDRLLPPYVSPDGVRVYVIENKEWNAFAMGNYSVYVFSGLLQDMDDDEVAIVLGHELAHATHEHTRRQFKKAMWIQLAALGAMVATDNVDSKKQRALAGLLVTFGVLAWKNGYGRDLEDQADRVGLRYAYEAGYDVTRGPALWNRFAKKYGEKPKALNFFFSDHSQASARAANLQRELALNYRDGRKEGATLSAR
jgi:hypothetical protein